VSTRSSFVDVATQNDLNRKGTLEMAKHTDPNLKKCVCSKCGVESMAVVGTRHRRCSGHMNIASLSKTTMKLPKSERGTWKA